MFMTTSMMESRVPRDVLSQLCSFASSSTLNGDDGHDWSPRRFLGV